MTDKEEKVVAQVSGHAARLGVRLDDLIVSVSAVQVLNPVGFDFACKDTGVLVKRIIESAKFGFDDPDTLHGKLAGSNAKRSGFHTSFRENTQALSLHVQVSSTEVPGGGRKVNVHLDSVGITAGRAVNGGNIFDLSKIVEHWDRDLRPEMGPLKHFDVTVVRGRNEVTGTADLGLVVSVRRRF